MKETPFIKAGIENFLDLIGSSVEKPIANSMELWYFHLNGESACPETRIQAWQKYTFASCAVRPKEGRPDCRRKTTQLSIIGDRIL